MNEESNIHAQNSTQTTNAGDKAVIDMYTHLGIATVKALEAMRSGSYDGVISKIAEFQAASLAAASLWGAAVSSMFAGAAPDMHGNESAGDPETERNGDVGE